jgi:mannose/cellobiose epimerase-like protein (N-acyl-D-glucosamine 2-epimerase family)
METIMTTPLPILPPLGPSWRSNRSHRSWLFEQADNLFDFFQHAIINPAGGFFDLDDAGLPIEITNPVRQIHNTTRMVHCFAIGTLLGRPGCDAIVDHGMTYLWNAHRDVQNGGYVWSLDNNGPKDDTKQAYGHAFVLLAASSAKTVGHPLADRLIQDITQVLEERFWEEQHGAVTEEFSRDWQPLSQYRGQNSNMHLTESLMAAFEATGDRAYLDKAERIAGLIIGRHAASLGYRVAEHFHADWSVPMAPRPAIGSNGPASFSSSGHWAASAMPGCPRPPVSCSGSPSSSDGIRTRAVSSTLWTGTTGRGCRRSCGGPVPRPSGQRRS